MDKSQEELGYIIKPRTEKRIPIREFGKALSTEKAKKKYFNQALESLKADIKS